MTGGLPHVNGESNASPDDSVKEVVLETRILSISLPSKTKEFLVSQNTDHSLQNGAPSQDQTEENLQKAATALRTTSYPVAFPTETVYGLAADATSSAAVRGIFTAKRRPADNPLIVHVSSLDMLRSLIRPGWPQSSDDRSSTESQHQQQQPQVFQPDDPIPSIYHPLITKFWPGPLTILLPLSPNSPLAPEVSAGQPAFGARLPSSAVALALIKATNRPLAAPSANASTRPSPTTAQHVYEDLQGRIELILDGGPCSVGVESTVVDGLCEPPVVLRPGGVGIEEIRACEGWEAVERGWEDRDQSGAGKGAEGTQGREVAPRAPGMKYRHYAPRARVVLVEVGAGAGWQELVDPSVKRVGVVRTKNWAPVSGDVAGTDTVVAETTIDGVESGTSSAVERHTSEFEVRTVQKDGVEISDMFIGPKNTDVARGLFSALRDLDSRAVEMILVEGIDDTEGETAAAVMNRLRKAAGERVKA